MMDFILLPIIFILTAFPTEVFLYEQSDYILTTQRINLTSYNEKYLNANAKFFKFNRTYTAINATYDIKRFISSRITVYVQAYKFQSNEYRLFPVAFSKDICEVLQTDEFGLQNTYNCGNFTGCPYKPQMYHICNWGPNYSKFPPYLRHGEYKLNLDFKYFQDDLFTMDWYIKVVGVNPF